MRERTESRRHSIHEHMGLAAAGREFNNTPNYFYTTRRLLVKGCYNVLYFQNLTHYLKLPRCLLADIII